MNLNSQVIIEIFEVSGIDPETYSLTIRSASTGEYHYNVPWMCPYSSEYKGQGIYFMPEIGSKCLGIWSNPRGEKYSVSSSPSVPIIIGFIPEQRVLLNKDSEETSLYPKGNQKQEIMADRGSIDKKNPGRLSYRNRREKLIPGDIVPGKTSSGNKIILYTGGVTQITATDICQRLYISVDNWIRDFCQNYILSCDGGYAKWHDNIDSSDPDNPKLMTTFEHHIRADGDDKINRVINIWRGFDGDLYKMVITGNEDLNFDTIDKSFREASSTYVTMEGETKYVVPDPSTLDLIEEVEGEGNKVVGKWIDDEGVIHLINRNDIKVASEGNINVFADKSLNLAVNEDARISICYSDAPHHKIIIHAKNTEDGSKLYFYSHGERSGTEAYDVRVETGDINTVVNTMGNIRQDIVEEGDHSRRTSTGNIQDETAAGNITQKTSAGEIKQETCIGDITRYVVEAGGIIDYVTAGDIASETAQGQIIQWAPAGIYINCFPIPLPPIPATPVDPIPPLT